MNEIEERITKINEHLEELIKQADVKGDIKKKANQGMQEEMRRQVLKRQLQEINRELYGSEKDELGKLEQKLNEAGLPDDIKEKVMPELNRLRQMTPRDPDFNIQKKYLDTIADLPWKKASIEKNDIMYAEQILNRDHAGLEKIKKRILEFLAVKILKKNSKGSILCFQGPPGVGKTSLGKSIAEALGRKFERVSLGGVRDEAEMRGHRRTYIGAMPGVFIEAMLRAKTNNPVILLDEIDKLGKNSNHGDPSSALLEILDPNQNHTFKDHYLGVPFDLSNVLFIGTANYLETIPGPLLDRMEIINLSGYTVQEKLEIAKNYLIPKQITENGLDKTHIEFNDHSLKFLIDRYTREAGVRSLERNVASICRKVAFEYLRTVQIGEKDKTKSETPFSTVKVTNEFVEEVLGPRVNEDDVSTRIDQPGISIGMAWT
jgi:ATP-dependent Lon protease